MQGTFVFTSDPQAVRVKYIRIDMSYFTVFKVK